MTIGAALSAALTPVWRVPVTITSPTATAAPAVFASAACAAPVRINMGRRLAHASRVFISKVPVDLGLFEPCSCCELAHGPNYCPASSAAIWSDLLHLCHNILIPAVALPTPAPAPRRAGRPKENGQESHRLRARG